MFLEEKDVYSQNVIKIPLWNCNKYVNSHFLKTLSYHKIVRIICKISHKIQMQNNWSRFHVSVQWLLGCRKENKFSYWDTTHVSWSLLKLWSSDLSQPQRLSLCHIPRSTCFISLSISVLRINSSFKLYLKRKQIK